MIHTSYMQKYYSSMVFFDRTKCIDRMVQELCQHCDIDPEYCGRSRPSINQPALTERLE